MKKEIIYTEQQHNPYKPDFYKNVKDLARYYVFYICYNF